MTILCLIGAVLSGTAQNILKKAFGKRCRGGTFFFSAVTALFALAVFLAVNRSRHYDPAVLPYASGFAASYICATVFALLAIRYGSLAKTSLILSYSLLVPCAYGILFLGEPVTPSLLIGLAALGLSLFLIRGPAEKEKTPPPVNDTRKDVPQPQNEKLPARAGRPWLWLTFVLLAFAGNGLCSTVQKAEGLALGSDGTHLFMITALGISAAVMLALSLFSPEERGRFGTLCRRGFWLGALCGILNGVTNVLVIFLNPQVPASVLFPLIGGGGMVLVFLWSCLFEKETFTVRQIVGFILGVLSIVLLNF